MFQFSEKMVLYLDAGEGKPLETWEIVPASLVDQLSPTERFDLPVLVLPPLKFYAGQNEIAGGHFGGKVRPLSYGFPSEQDRGDGKWTTLVVPQVKVNYDVLSPWDLKNRSPLLLNAVTYAVRLGLWGLYLGSFLGLPILDGAKPPDGFKSWMDALGGKLRSYQWGWEPLFPE